tara:strand:+ start:55 stop:270 length:216 start_codon:yes stop_codon:yes gene_type:complete
VAVEDQMPIVQIKMVLMVVQAVVVDGYQDQHLIILELEILPLLLLLKETMVDLVILNVVHTEAAEVVAHLQ